MALSRLATAFGGLLLSRGGRRFAGRHAGKLALATLAWELYRQHRGRTAPGTALLARQSSSASRQHRGRTAPGTAAPRSNQDQTQAQHPRQRWSGRRA